MPAIARADLESLLRLKKLDHTLTRALPADDDAADARWVVPTGVAGLDARLQGGIPRGHLSELVGRRSSGRLAVVLSALAGATSRGEAVALVDPLDMFDPVSAAASGIDFMRMLWIRGQAGAPNTDPMRGSRCSTSRDPNAAAAWGWKALNSARISLACEFGTLQKSLDAAVKALNLVLQAGGFGLVALDLTEIAPQVLRRLPFTTWLRLHRVIEGSETACVLIGSEPLARSAGGVTVQLESGKARVIGSRTREIDKDVCVSLSAAAC